MAATATRIELFPYQRDTIAFVERADGRAIIGHETGVGKTPIAIRYCADRNLRTLVVCPASLKRQWQREIHKFAPEALAYIIGPLTCDLDTDFAITNYDVLGWDAAMLQAQNFDAIILDEAQLIKEFTPASGKRKAQGSQRAKLVHELFGDIEHKLLLTGTAIKSRPGELFSLLHFIDPFTWHNPWAYARKMGYMREQEIYVAGGKGKTKAVRDMKGDGDGLRIHEDIKDVYIRYTKAEVRADMPAKLRSTVTLDLSPQDAAQYRALERAWLACKFEGAHLAALTELRHWCADRKPQYLKEFIDGIVEAEQRAVLFASFHSTLDLAEDAWCPLTVRFDGTVSQITRDRAVQAFMSDYDDAPQLFLVQTQAGGVGLNLNHPRAGTVVFLDLPWTPADLMQAEDRCYRITNEHPITSVRAVFAGTVEEQVLALLERKEVTLARVLEGKEDFATEELETSVLGDLIAHYREAR